MILIEIMFVLIIEMTSWFLLEKKKKTSVF